MKSRFSPIVLLSVLPFFLFMSSGGENHASGSLDFIGKVVNFVVLFGGLSFLLYKPAKKFLTNRSLSIGRSISQAEDSRVEAEAKLKDGERRLAELSREVSGMKKAASEAGLKEKERILKEAQAEMEKLQQSTRLEIEMLSKAGIKELKEHALTLASIEALDRIRKRLTDRDQAELIDKSIDQLESLYE